jgi:hypothetical protein
MLQHYKQRHSPYLTTINHKTTMKRHLLILCLAVSSTRVFAGSATLADFSITAFNPSGVAYTEQLSALFGTYSGGVFTPLIVTSPTIGVNSGYLINADEEFQLNLTQGNNNNVVAGTALFASIYQGTTYSPSAAQIVLTDPSWIAPTFTITTPELAWELSASTAAVSVLGQTGTFNYNAGSPEVTLAVPEPSTYALFSLAGLALGGYAVRRRRRA